MGTISSRHDGQPLLQQEDSTKGFRLVILTLEGKKCSKGPAVLDCRQCALSSRDIARLILAGGRSPKAYFYCSGSRALCGFIKSVIFAN